MAKFDVSPSELKILHACKEGNGQKTKEELAVMLGYKKSTFSQMLSTLNGKFKKAGKKFPVPGPKLVRGGGRTSQSISIDDAIAALADVGDDETVSVETAAE